MSVAQPQFQPGGDSFLFDDADPDVSVAPPSIPALNKKTVREIAAYLDAEINKDTPSASSTGTTQTELAKTERKTSQTSSATTATDKKKIVSFEKQQNRIFQSPASDREMAPLFQSTPMDTPKGAQPKDLLKQKLSRLGQTVVTAEADISTGNITESDTSKSTTIQEDTPSKSRPVTSTSFEKLQQQRQLEIEKEHEKQLRELSKLRDLRQFFLEMEGGCSMIERIPTGARADQYRVINKNELREKDDALSSSQSKNTTLQAQLAELQQQLEMKDQELKAEKERTADLTRQTDQLNATNSELATYQSTLQAQIQTLEDSQQLSREKTMELEQKITALKTTQSDELEAEKKQVLALTQEVASLKKSHLEELTEQKKEVASLNQEVSKLQSMNHELRDEANIIKGTNMSLKEMLELKDKLIVDYQAEKLQLASTIDDLRKSLIDLTAEYDRYKESSTTELASVRGNLQEAITPERYPELMEKTDCGSPLYEDLELGAIDALSQIEAQNTIKNVLINLGIPFSKTRQMVPNISLQLQREDILREFVAKTHKLLYNEDMNLDYYLGMDTRGKEHLSHCTTQMFKNLEVLYSVLKKTVV